MGFAPRTRYDAPVREPTTTPDNLSTVFLAQIVIATILGVVLSFALDPILEESGANLIFLLFICISISEVIMARFVVQKQLREGAEGARQQAIVLANAFAGAIAVYGLVIGILGGFAYFVVPFGVIALFAWQYLHNIIRTTPDTPSRFRKARNR